MKRPNQIAVGNAQRDGDPITGNRNVDTVPLSLSGQEPRCLVCDPSSRQLVMQYRAMSRYAVSACAAVLEDRPVVASLVLTLLCLRHWEGPMATHPFVLLVEPDPLLRHLIHGELKDHGCIVFGTADQRDALALAGLYPGAIDLAVTDLPKPHQQNHAFESALRSLPTGTQARILDMSTATDAAPGASNAPEQSYLMKPFDRESRLEAVQQALVDTTLTAQARGRGARGLLGCRAHRPLTHSLGPGRPRDAEDRRDRREDRWDARHDGGQWDRREDIRDRRRR